MVLRSYRRKAAAGEHVVDAVQRLGDMRRERA